MSIGLVFVLALLSLGLATLITNLTIIQYLCVRFIRYLQGFTYANLTNFVLVVNGQKQKFDWKILHNATLWSKIKFVWSVLIKKQLLWNLTYMRFKLYFNEYFRGDEAIENLLKQVDDRKEIKK